MDFKKELELVFNNLVNQIGHEDMYYALQDLEHDLGLAESGTALTYSRPEVKPEDFQPLEGIGTDKEGFKQTPYDKEMGNPFVPVDEVVAEDKAHSHCFDPIKKEIEENEVIELNDILEEGNPEALIKSNIEYVLKDRGAYDRASEEGKSIKVEVDLAEQGEDALMGFFRASNGYETLEGVFIADGFESEGKFHINSLTLGDSDLKYFGK